MEARSDGTQARRRFLKSMGAAALAPLVGAGWAAPTAAAGPAAAGPVAVGLAADRPAVVAVGGVFLVNGWVLTRADLAALGFHAR